MAERRMFTKKITDSDAFLDMPLSSQALYFHINMAADDEGFVNNPKKIQRMIGASDDDLRLLVAKNFLIPFESGVIVVKHWRMHNYIQKDRFHPTVYQDERQALSVKKNGAYTIAVDEMDTKCIQDVSNMDTEVRLGKVSIEKDNKGRFTPPTVEEVKAYCLERGNNVDAESFVSFYESKGWLIGKNKMKDWKAAVRTWERSRKKDDKPDKPKFDSFTQRDYDFSELERIVNT